MKKRLIVLALGVLISANLLPPTIASAANVPTAQSKTITLTKDEMDIGSEIKDPNVKVEVTYTGWLGEIDAAQNGVERSAINGKIAVLKEGSEIRFKITSTDPAAYYNFCYDKTRFADDTYGWDDSGSGWYYYNNEMMNVMTYGQADGTTKFAAGPLFRPELKTFGRKISTSTYAYQAVNGLMEYHFTAKYKPENNDYIPQGGVAEYLLGTALTINDEQIKELEETGTMTFLKGITMGGTQDVSFQREYQGLSELLGLGAPRNPQIKITAYEGLYDAGHTYDYTITNTTGKAIDAYYGLLFYKAKAYDEGKYGINWGHDFYTFHLTLDPNESVSGMLATDSLLAQYESPIWIRFDSQQALWDFIPDTLNQTQDSLFKMFSVGKFTPEWMKETFGINIPVIKVNN